MESQHIRVSANDNESVAGGDPRIRLEPIVSIRTGAWIALSARPEGSFEDWTSMDGPVCSSPVRWLRSAIEASGRAVMRSGMSERPIALVTPLTALCRPESARQAREGARRCNIDPAEIRLEFPDSAVSVLGLSALDAMKSFARMGFRIGLDARQGLRVPAKDLMNSPVEAIRIDSLALDLIEIDTSEVRAAAEAGISVYAENARWPGARELLSLGVDAVIVSGEMPAQGALV